MPLSLGLIKMSKVGYLQLYIVENKGVWSQNLSTPRRKRGFFGIIGIKMCMKGILIPIYLGIFGILMRIKARKLKVAKHF